jgi:hypothetical protein
MIYFFLKVFVSAILIAAISELAKKSVGLAALIASLPVVSILAIIWIWLDTHDIEKISQLSKATFWLVIPSLPMFLILPIFLKSSWNIWFSLIVCTIITFVFYLITIKLLDAFKNIY